MRRLLIFVAALTLVVSLCVVFGIRERGRTEDILTGMFRDGRVVGKFWYVVHADTSRVVAAKFGRSIALEVSLQPLPSAGNRISFIAVRSRESSESVWRVEEIRVHGKGTFKYAVSTLAIAVVFFLLVIDFSIDLSSASIVMKKKGQSCRKD